MKTIQARGRYIDKLTLEMYDIEQNMKILQEMNIVDIIPDYKHNEYVIHGKSPDQQYLISVRVPFEVADVL